MVKGKKVEEAPQTQKKSVFAELGSVSDEALSLGASLAMGVLLVFPGLMAVMAMIKQSIDFTMNMYMSMIKNLAFPLACSIVLLIYILVIIRLQAKGISLKTVLKHNPVFVLFFAASFFIVISQFYNGMEYALTGFCAASLGETFGMEICYFIFILFGATQVKIESHKRFLLRTQIIISCILVLTAFIVWHTQIESTFFSDWTPRYSSIFSNTNYYGYYLAVSVPLAGAAFVYEAGIVWKIIAGLSFIINTVALSINDTMGAWIGAIFAVIFIVVAHFIIEKKVNWQTLVLIPVFGLCLFLPAHINGTFEQNFSTLTSDVSNIMEGNEEAEHAGSARWKIWKASLDIVKENKFMGIGFEGVKQKAYVGPPYNIRPHNEFIQYAMFHGIPMVIFYFLGCLGIFIRALLKRKAMNGATLVSLSAAFGYLVSAFFGLTLFSTGYFLFVFLGMGYVNGDPESSPKADSATKNRKENIYIFIAAAAATAVFSIISLAGGKAEKSKGSETITINNEPAVTADQNSPEEVMKNLPLFTVGDIAYYTEGDHAVVFSTAVVNSDISEIVIPEKVEHDGSEYPVTVIGDSAFETLGELKSVTLPASIKQIGKHAFDTCESLTEITIPQGTEVIGDEAFNECTGLKSIIIPASIKEIGKEVFYECESLKTVEIKGGLSVIPSGTFYGCIALEEVKLPQTITSIGIEAFEGCEALKEIELPEGLVSIEDHAFDSCSLLKEIKLPSTISTVGEGIFDFCDSLKTVYVPENSVSRFKEKFADAEFKVKGY